MNGAEIFLNLERLDLYYEHFNELVMPLYCQHVLDNVCDFLQRDKEMKTIVVNSEGRLYIIYGTNTVSPHNQAQLQNEHTINLHKSVIPFSYFRGKSLPGTILCYTYPMIYHEAERTPPHLRVLCI